MSTEREQLEQAIAALEAQRTILGDAAVNAALTGLHQRLVSLELPAPETEKRRQITILFADISSFTALSETMDAEEVREMINALWQRIDHVIIHYSGTIDKHMGDAVMALWGVQATREDDAEQAIRAALEMQSIFKNESEKIIGDFPSAMIFPSSLQIRIGINTGQVLLGAVGTTSEYTAMGAAVNLASRLEQAAPTGSILISQNTYRQVVGLFDVHPQEPLSVKGISEPVDTYIVQRAKPRTFRMATRGIEGIATHMVGRDSELGVLKDAYQNAMHNAQTHLVTIVGDAGLGKSRLLLEFRNWLETQPDPIMQLSGRATPEMASSPYSLLRDMFREHFEILESDEPRIVQQKFEAGVAPYLDVERAHLVGHLVGFDFSSTTEVQNLAGNPSFATMATAYLTNYFRGITKALTQPNFEATDPRNVYTDLPESRLIETVTYSAVILLFEDLHWADRASMDFITHLIEELTTRRFLIVCLTRPTLYENLPSWGKSAATTFTSKPLTTTHCLRLNLTPLSPDDSRTLVNDILHKVDSLPENLRTLVVDNAEGNPFYVEELIKMFVEDGVILRGENRWQVAIDKLKRVQVPATLTDVLQARLDSLPPIEKELLQQASVIGRIFWDSALTSLNSDQEASNDELLAEQNHHARQKTLEALYNRELIYPHLRSSFDGIDEFSFKHALLRDVTYETVLLKNRRLYHQRAARWLEIHGGERLNEYARSIAEHYERAGDKKLSAAWHFRAGEAAMQSGAIREAIADFELTMAYLLPVNISPEPDTPVQASRLAEILVKIGNAYILLGDYSSASEKLRAGLEQWSIHLPSPSLHNLKITADAYNGLSQIAIRQGAYDEADRLSKEALDLAQKAGAFAGMAVAYQRLGIVAWYRGEFIEASRALENSRDLYQQIGDRRGVAACLNNLGLVSEAQGNLDAAFQNYEKSLEISRNIGDRRGIAYSLGNLGLISSARGDYPAALQYNQDSLVIARDIGDRDAAAICLENLGHIAQQLGNDQQAEQVYKEALTESMAIGAVRITLSVLAGLASLKVKTGQAEPAAKIIGYIISHPAYNSDVASYADPVLEMLRNSLPPGTLSSALERGKMMDIDPFVCKFLQKDKALIDIAID